MFLNIVLTFQSCPLLPHFCITYRCTVQFLELYCVKKYVRLNFALANKSMSLGQIVRHLNIIIGQFNTKTLICGLYYKHIMIVNDDSCIINKWSLSLTDDAGVVINNCNMFIIQAGHFQLQFSCSLNLLIGVPLEDRNLLFIDVVKTLRRIS
jgi:hypothetical protein